MSQSALQDQVAFLTGAGSGLGAAIARRLAAEGATVVGIRVNAVAVRYLAVDATYSFGEIIPVSGGWLA